MNQAVLLQLNGDDLQTMIVDAIRSEFAIQQPAPQALQDDEMLTQKQVAELLQSTKQSVIRWTQQGRLKAYRIGGRAVRYKKSEVLRSGKERGN